MSKSKPDLEERLQSTHPLSLHLWLRVLSITSHLESEWKSLLKAQFAQTPARFELMAQLEHEPKGLQMGELAKRLMVSGANVTAIVDQLVDAGLAKRSMPAGDRRSYTVALTPKGLMQCAQMTSSYESWVATSMATLSETEQSQLHHLLGQIKRGWYSQALSAERPVSPRLVTDTKSQSRASHTSDQRTAVKPRTFFSQWIKNWQKTTKSEQGINS